jgi:hypothetical protein
MFKYYNPLDPMRKIMLAPGVDFLLNFVSQTNFDAGLPIVVDDGKDALFGDLGNDWLVGGTNEDHLYGGYGNDLLNADDNLDSTRVDVTVTFASLKALTLQWASNPGAALELTEELDDAQWYQSRGWTSSMLRELQDYANQVRESVACLFTADQAATLTRLVAQLMGIDNLANNIPDPRGSAPSYADIAVGGAGRDILIGNTSSDRLYDWYGDVNTFVVPFEWHEGEGHDGWHDGWHGDWHDGWHGDGDGGRHGELIQYLTDLAISDGADTTRGGDVLRNGEPYGELGLVLCGDRDFAAQIGREREHEHYSENNADQGSLGFTVLHTPSADLERIEERYHHDLDEELRRHDMDEALLHRIVVLGQLTPADQALLSVWSTYDLNWLLGVGYLSKSPQTGVVAATDKLWYALGLADAPSIDELHDGVSGARTTGVTLSGHGDVSDLIRIYNGSTVVASGFVAADGTWSITFNTLAVGIWSLRATQTVQTNPHFGLESALSDDVRATIRPDAPSVLSVSHPPVTRTTAPVTLTGRGDANDTITLYDGYRAIAATFVAADGSWSITVSLAVGAHALSATQTSPAPLRLTSDASNPTIVQVYAPPAAPTISVAARATSQLTVGGTGVAGATVTLTEGAASWTTTVGANGSWSRGLTLAIGPHTLTATQTVQYDPFTVATSGTSTVALTVYPDAPTLTAPAVATTTAAVTLGGTGVAGMTITLWDGATRLGAVTVLGDGSWSFLWTFAAGSHSLTATQTSNGYVSLATGAALLKVYAPPAAPTIVAPANSRSTVTLSGTGAAGNTIRVSEGGTTWTTTVLANGTWSLAPTLALGTHTLQAIQIEPNTGQTSSAVAVTVKVYAAPAAPVIAASTPAATRTTSPVTITGSGTVGETISIYDGGTLIKTVTLTATGAWSTTVNLGVGSHTLSATRTVVAGVPSDRGPSVVVVVAQLKGGSGGNSQN